MESAFVNPEEEIQHREYVQLENIQIFVKEYVHKEMTGYNPGAYCATHHTIETRTTLVYHSNCKLYKAKDFKGEALVFFS